MYCDPSSPQPPPSSDAVENLRRSPPPPVDANISPFYTDIGIIDLPPPTTSDPAVSTTSGTAVSIEIPRTASGAPLYSEIGRSPGGGGGDISITGVVESEVATTAAGGDSPPEYRVGVRRDSSSVYAEIRSGFDSPLYAEVSSGGGATSAAASTTAAVYDTATAPTSLYAEIAPRYSVIGARPPPLPTSQQQPRRRQESDGGDDESEAETGGCDPSVGRDHIPKYSLLSARESLASLRERGALLQAADTGDSNSTVYQEIVEGSLSMLAL